jgi:5'-phosphate synthase pdxT subunit
MNVGVLALQGDFERHLDALREIGAPGQEVRSPEDLQKVTRLIIPGGESTTVGMLMKRTGFDEALRERHQDGLPIWGTCMGMIMLAKEIEGRPNQFSLGFLDITVRRNAFGAQVHSFEDTLTVEGIPEPVTAVFIRAPIVTQCGPNVQSICEYQGQTVAVREGRCLGTSFHPELTDDTQFHRWFLSSAFD